MKKILYRALMEIDTHIELLPPGYSRHKLRVRRTKLADWGSRRYRVNLHGRSFFFMRELGGGVIK